MGQINISVIIPVYNAERYLSLCLDSVLSQTIRKIEVICINDGSTDGSAEILKSFREKDERVIIYRQKNSGSGPARNLGLHIAQGEYIAFLDADDYYPSNSVLKSMYDCAAENRVAICGGGISVERDGIVTPGNKRGIENHFLEPGIINYYDVQYDYGYQRYLFSHKLLEENQIYFPDYLRFQDPPFLVRAMLRAKQFYAITEDTYCYRYGHQNINWTFRKTNDLVRGLLDLLTLSRDNRLSKLHKQCVNRMNQEYAKIIENSLLQNNRELLYLLIKFNCAIDLSLIGKANNYSEPYLIAPLCTLIDSNRSHINTVQNKELLNKIATLQKEINSIHASATYRIGSFFTFIPRKLRGGIRCYREHGMAYTLRRIKEKFLGLFGR